MNIRYLLSNLKLVERNHEWFKAPMPLSTKLAYYPALAGAFIRMVSSGNKQITYLGKPFIFDNPAAPLNLQNYPYEVGNKLLQHMEMAPKSVLDVGANIGQFACTLSYLVPEAKIDSFEPNPEIFQTLKANATSNMKVYNYGLDAVDGESSFYYEPNRSAIGSFVKDNAGTNSALKEITVKTVKDVAKLTGRSEYDLVKVDVEGFEYEVLQGLKGIRPKYLYIEVSGAGRTRSYTDAKIYRAIEEIFGDFQVRYSSGLNEHSATYELLIEFMAK